MLEELGGEVRYVSPARGGFGCHGCPGGLQAVGCAFSPLVGLGSWKWGWGPGVLEVWLGMCAGGAALGGHGVFEGVGEASEVGETGCCVGRGFGVLVQRSLVGWVVILCRHGSVMGLV